MRFFRDRILPEIVKYAATLAIAALTTALLLPLRGFLGVQVIALVYLFPVLLATFLWGLIPGVLAAFASFLVFNYFFLPPYRTFAVHQSQDLLTLMALLVIAVMASNLIGRARAGMRLAKLREWEATRLYELILALSGTHDAERLGQTLAAHLRETFACRQAQVRIAPEGAQPERIITHPQHAPETALPDRTLPMHTSRGSAGEIRLWIDNGGISKENERLLAAFASQGALSVERIRLSESEHKTKVLEETDRAKSSLLSSVSHELRSPLAAIKASVSSLRSEVVEWDSSARHELLATIEEETDHLNFLVGNLLDMSRIEAGALQPQRRWNALSEILTGVLTRMRKQLLEYRVVLDLAPDMPLLPTDYVLMDQVFTNLLRNSIKYAPPGTQITIRARIEGETAHLMLRNQGPPVPEANLGRIFEKFNRVGSRDRVTGTGLGLSICKGIIEAHEGAIWAQNSPDGFEYHIRLPKTLDGSPPVLPDEAGHE